ncbi:metabotropic glutamate receptor 2-like [Limulus polyphemus]|uniref:Metabotropic glutamate receptor 2-like n=1 Tax=Limulus polyphemus TaxID=6850 RepID=A0ABM1TNJ1_LIMPO|nr:metabotropic glutamate receptor 2-like [Limulus polyphemus]XP_022257447.1 metabotropic glutamate receptor 2-like [Limulus polyphemus]
MDIIQSSVAQSPVSDFTLPDVSIETSRSAMKDFSHQYFPEQYEDTNSLFSDSLRLRDDLWILPLIVLSSLNAIIIAIFEVFVIYKARGTTPSRRHLFLGQILLLGLFLCSMMGFAFVPTAHWITCTVLRVGLGLAYTLVFATLLVKSVFLLSLHAGVYLPASYQGLLLFFVVIVQVVIGVQWVVQRPPAIISRTETPTCNTSVANMLMVLIYPMFLILCVTVLSIKAKGNRENHREAMFIGIAIGFTIPVWFSWILVAIATEPRYHDAAMAFGIVTNAIIIFLVMFLPKGRQLAAMGRDGLYPEDRDELSSSSPSICTPSFLHIKPPLIPLNKQERIYYLPPPTGRVWRCSYPVFPHVPIPPPEDTYFYPGERNKASFYPNTTFFKTPLY